MLVIDDEPPIRLLCRVNLEAEGIEVLEAGDGLSGARARAGGRRDVILLDVMLPGLDGLGVAEELLADERTRSIPIVFLTAAPSCATVRAGSARRRRVRDEAVRPARRSPRVIRELRARGGEPLRRESIAELRRILGG